MVVIKDCQNPVKEDVVDLSYLFVGRKEYVYQSEDEYV